MQEELFEKLSIPKAYFKLALPVVLGMVVSLVYNLVDTYFIAGTGNADLIAGVALCAPVFTLMVAVGDIFGIGGSSLISRLLGEKRIDDVRRVSVVCFWTSFGTGIAVAAIMLVFRTPILYMLGADNDTFPYAAQYYTGIVIGAPFIIFSLAPSNILRTEGLAAAAMLGTVSGALINVILDPLFISGLGWGASGAAAASSLGYAVSDVVFIWALVKKSQTLSLNPGLFKVKAAETAQILSIGIPASITNFMQSFGIMMLNRRLLHYGTDKIAAMGVVMKISMIAVLLLVGFAFGAQPLLGYNYGAQNWKRLKKAISFTCFFECGFAAFLLVVLAVPAPQFVGIFLEDAALREIGTVMLRFQISSIVFTSFVLTATVICQSMGKAFGALLLSASRQGVLFLIVLIVMEKMLGYHGVLAAQPVSDALTAVLAGICLIRYLPGLGRRNI